ncbi:Uma2 family endonuclease [Leucothrix pacifica]|uniref:Putative restriction endonuclease domain-containing protein n=1 Tax=Leucothrix pacifica TaxID=1247513 RepID=A0A317CPK7_9GAMM|nr:Uma2 family endonuclease [Leucothrix pacifica]PWR00375.1 hypothetical protein DKW60_02145 [Leucothrix pacifica]
MPLAEQHNQLSVEDYLEGERQSEVRHEFADGSVYAMAGASINHNQITANLLTSLVTHLRGTDCRPFSSDLLVKTSKDHYRYPDVTVVCDDQFIDDYSTDSPLILIEVLSKGTHQLDRQIKRLEYINLPSLQEYVLVEQERVEVEVFRRNQGWQPSYYYWDDVVELESVGMSLSVQAIYEQVRNGEVEELMQQVETYSADKNNA